MLLCVAASLYEMTYAALYYRVKKSKEVEDVLNAGMVVAQNTAPRKFSVITGN
jgi:hypothetical protein